MLYKLEVLDLIQASFTLGDDGASAEGLVLLLFQVPRKLIGTDAFQETPIVEVTRQITKHNYLVMDLDDLPRIVKEVTYCLELRLPGMVKHTAAAVLHPGTSLFLPTILHRPLQPDAFVRTA